MAEDDQFQLLQEAFLRCDRDGDRHLNRTEFLEFCDVGLGKPQQDAQMYMAFCTQLSLDPDVGPAWSDIRVMFSASNSAPDEELPPEDHRPHHRQSSMSHSYENARHDRNASMASLGDFDDDLSQTSDRPPFHHRAGSMKRESSMAEMAIIEALQGSNEAQTKKLKQIGKQLKHANKKLHASEREKQQTAEELQRANQQLTNMHASIQAMEQEKIELKDRIVSERSRFEEKIRLLQNQLDDDRKSIQHLEGRHQQAQQERDQVLQLFKNAETQFEQQLTTIKRKHKDQLEKVSVGFLQSLGAQPGEDIRQIVRDLREEKKNLTQQVAMLAEQLTRKDRSLFEALQAVDALSLQQKQAALRMQTGRRASRTLPAGSRAAIAATSPPEAESGGSTPGGDYSSRFDKPTNPDFFVQAVSDGSGSAGGISASQSNAHRPVGPEGQAKQYEFVANAMVAQVAEKEEQIENLRAANEYLGQQLNEKQTGKA